jgi:hypothetical protein
MHMHRPSNHKTLQNDAKGQQIDLKDERNEAKYAAAARRRRGRQVDGAGGPDEKTF